MIDPSTALSTIPSFLRQVHTAGRYPEACQAVLPKTGHPELNCIGLSKKEAVSYKSPKKGEECSKHTVVSPSKAGV